jgi:endo-1,4-beta-xylanase
MAIAAVAGALLLTGCQKDSHDQRPQDLIAGTWDYMPGTEVRGDTLHVHHTGLAVLELEEAGRPPKQPQYEANPPVNLYGTHLNTSDKNNVGVHAQLTNIEGTASLSLLETPPTRYDEHIDYAAGISLDVNSDKATMHIWDGRHNTPVQSSIIPGAKATDGKAAVSVEQDHDATSVAVNGAKVTIPRHVIGDEVWFGFDASEGWDLAKLTSHGAQQIDTSKTNHEISGKGLYAAMDRSGNGDKYIGTAVDMTMLAANPEYERMVAENFNEIEPEMAGKFQALQPEKGQYEFKELDGLVKWAEKNDKQVHGHTLSFTEAYPQWLSDTLQDPSTSGAEARAILEDFVTTVVERYDGKHGHGEIKAWDVNNEVFDPENWGELNTQSIWYQKLGPSYITDALKAAHKANPEAKLFINEWGMETDGDRRSAMLELVQELKADGVPVDGVGFQAHFDKDTLNDDTAMSPLYDGKLPEYMQEFQDAGVDVRISEASVAEAGDAETQRDTYEALAEACMRAENCDGVNIWGASNSSFKGRYPYFTGSNENQDPGDDAPTVQNKDGKITYRPAWYGLRDGLSYND